MSAAQPDATLEDKLEALECHFTWGLQYSRARLLRLGDKLEDIGTAEGNRWLGHIYNLQGYIHHQLGFNDEARSFFSRAAEAFCQIRNVVPDEGPWLVVNFGNKAWLHYSLGEHAETRVCLSRVDELMRAYPSPSEVELHPEICAEKAWTLMKFGPEKELLAADYFQKAIRMQPEMVEWQTSHVLALANTSNKDEILEKMRIAQRHDPQNFYLAAVYLEAQAERGQRIESKARELARRVLEHPVGSYSGIAPLLRVYKLHLSPDEAIHLAEEALERHPDERFLKMRAALCYKDRIFLNNECTLEDRMINRAISLHKDVSSLYPNSSLKIKISLANIYGKSHRIQDGDQIFKELLQIDLEPEDAQLLYNYYAKYLKFIKNQNYESIKYHMEVAKIPEQTFFRKNSICILERIKDRNRNRMCREIEEFLANLQH
ncbi:interferon-induced protein with tetratricopeptide repeats 1-like [Echeneis naucrates]|uniref:interferon-induced protein with tetratricopeptide repeats 1-like n=1 Tax=Echeneis naucrates TaxID=173247 RepID=UPI00111345B5|nr:interferon-induced protein with tetratricopeptide repeats 1-like [Echeneis naucrates]